VTRLRETIYCIFQDLLVDILKTHAGSRIIIVLSAGCLTSGFKSLSCIGNSYPFELIGIGSLRKSTNSYYENLVVEHVPRFYSAFGGRQDMLFFIFGSSSANLYFHG
jgi:hypothetical protein